ncbi:subtilase-type protease inhibitor [Streptomyces cinnabarinus]|uniref:Subtilase-type protease inhibitor n=1 Tax=Streptomyces cinnabarinus TaxID=67287 RepID=A0ABY7KNB6_9ACTN|nr:SSI family serine proteinase inhibitor [Streptomyces cinnabarinus]WAZ24867.1 subtilase-type protease inhibitor [Streptomyces cinnabarinus]
MTLSTTVKAGTAKAGRAGVRGALSAAASLLVLATVPAHAADLETLPGNWLRLTLTTGDEQSSDTRGTLLMCDPPQGHGRAAEACRDLAAVHGDIDALGPEDTVCPMIYAPVTARASGQWNGRPVEYARTFGNSCEMAAWTGAVFALDSGRIAGLPGLD